jgi:uncharacterized protein
MSNNLFPIFLKTEKMRFLIVGGGKVGLEKTQTLLKQNPQVHIKIVALDFHEELKEVILKYPNVEHYQKHFEETDLDDCDIVITAIDDSVTSQQIKELANKRKLLVNAADQPEICDFYLGSIVKKGNLKLAISTNGKSPVMARRMREFFDDVLPENIDQAIESLHLYRNTLKGDMHDKIKKLNEITGIILSK